MGCEVGAGLRTNLGDRGVGLSVWTWGDLVGATEDISVGSETQWIEVRGRVPMGVEVGSVDGSTLGDNTGDGRVMVSLH